MDPAERFEQTRAEQTIDRRTVLAGAATVGVAAVAGCMNGGDGSEASVPDPITVDSDRACDNCTMIIGDYPGPTGQSFYEDPESVLGDGENRAAQFCSSRCTYAFTFENESKAEPEVSYLTDYSSVDYELDENGDQPEMEKFLDAETFAVAKDLTLVVDSDVRGAMDKSMIGFSDTDGAESFQAEWGGDVYEHDEVNRELIQSLKE
nr:nitrous oxide reductase accessory protein NosL [Natronococcus jeotgali]